MNPRRPQPKDASLLKRLRGTGKTNASRAEVKASEDRAKKAFHDRKKS